MDKLLFQAIKNGTGDRVLANDPDEPFAKVIRESSVQWTAYFVSQPPYPLNNLRFFASNGAGACVGAVAEVGPGHVVFLPNFKELNEVEFVEACREYRFGREGTPPPLWVDTLWLPGEAEANNRIKGAEEDIEKVQKALGVARTQRDTLCAYKKLTFEKGKTQLEPVVRRALDVLGFATKPSEIISGTNYEIDGRTTTGSSPGILEVKGSKKQILLDDFSPLAHKLLADHQNTGKASKGILVGNGLCEDAPETRLGEGVFSRHALEAARRSSVALINSVELYWLIAGVIAGRIKDLAAVRENILTTNGYVDLRSYCPEPPFQASGPDSAK